MGNYFQSDNGKDEGNNEEYPPEINNVFKNKNANQHSPHCTNPCPDSIYVPDREAVRHVC